jgi:uncharacterized protein YndB with AHSA1/START domain
MKWVLITVCGLVALAALVLLVGAMLPVRHHATRKAHYGVSPETLYAIISGPPDWRAGVKSFGILPSEGGRKRWWEEDAHGQKITYEIVEAAPPRRITICIADRSLPFGGTWIYEIAPIAGGGADLRISEEGEIYNVIFRFVARFFMGYTSTMEGFLRDLGTSLDEPVKIEG